MTRRIGNSTAIAVAGVFAFSLWTWLSLRRQAFAGLDAASLTPGVDARSPWGQVLAAAALVTTPVVLYVALASLAWWAARRRLSNLAWGVGLSIPLTWAAIEAIKAAVRRPRPPTAQPLITAEGWAYPSGHLTALTVLAVMVAAAMLRTRRSRPTLLRAVAALAVGWLFVAYLRWELRAHWFSDIIAGGLLGCAVAGLSLALAGVPVVRLLPTRRRGGRRRPAEPRMVVVLNPMKIPDPVVFRRHVRGECSQRGWHAPFWLETDADDAGAAAARRALRRRPDLVLVAGGDGTVRAVCAVLAGSDIPVGILPVGTGNLLARNLGVPLDLADALDTAFAGVARAGDLGGVQAVDRRTEYSLVMAGMGADALMMSQTNPELKKVVGPAAYVMAALQAVNLTPFALRVSLDGGEPQARTASLALVANVGQLQGAIPLAPDASPDDGLLDVLLASPRSPADWALLTTRVLTRAPDAPGVERAQAVRVVFEADEPVPFQVDGDAVGSCLRLEATVRAGAVTIMAP